MSIFTPAELANLYKTGALARSLHLNVNPSETGGAMSAIEDMTQPKRAFFKAVPAALTKAQWANRWMMTPPQPQTPIPLSTLLGPAVVSEGTGNDQE